MALTGAVERSAVIREIWTNKIDMAYFVNVVMEKLVNLRKAAGALAGDVQHYAIQTLGTAEVIGTDGVMVPSAQIMTDRTVTINTNASSSKEVLDQTLDLSIPGNVKTLTDTIGIELGTKIDTDLLGNHATWTGTAINSAAAPQPLAEGAIREASRNLVNVPRKLRYLVIHENNWTELSADPDIRSALAFGSALKTNPLFKGINEDGRVGFSLAGAEVYVSTNVPSVGGSRRNQMFHGPQLLFARATPMLFKTTSRAAALIYSTLFFARTLYGTGVGQTAGGVVIHNTL